MPRENEVAAKLRSRAEGLSEKGMMASHRAHLLEGAAEIEKLQEKCGKAMDILVAAIEDIGLRTCKRPGCHFLHMIGHVCYHCGWDPSVPANEQ